MVCEDVNILAPAEATPKMSRAMMVCEDVNITAGGGGPPSDHGGLAFGDLGPLIGMAEEDCCNTLFCVPASKQRFVPVVVGQQPVWQPPQPRAERVVPSNGEWECSEGPRLPRVVRRGVGGLKWEQTDRCTSTTPPAEPKCLFKRAAIAKQCFIYADMPRLMRCEMCGYANTRGYCGYGSESEESASSPSSTGGVHHHQSCVHGCCCECEHQPEECSSTFQLGQGLQWGLLLPLL